MLFTLLNYTIKAQKYLLVPPTLLEVYSDFLKRKKRKRSEINLQNFTNNLNTLTKPKKKYYN